MIEKKKLFIVIPTLGVGGGEKLVVDLVNNINKNKFEVTIVCLFNKKNTIYEDMVKNEKIIFMNKKVGVDFKIIFRLINLFKINKPDIVHTHLNVMQFVLPAMVINGVKVRIHTVHSIANKEAVGILRKIMYYSYKLFNVKPVAICDVVRESIKEVYNLNLGQINCIYNGVDNNLFTRDIKEIKNKNEIILITTGTLYPVKNHKLMISAFLKINKIFPETKLVILGDGELKNEIENKILEYNLEGKIILKGIVKDVAKELNKSDIYVMTSNYEGLPLSMLEAMACGLPIITTKAGGIVDIIKDDLNGILVDVGSEKQLIEAMKKMICNNDLRIAMGENSLKQSKKYIIKNVVNEYEKLYLNNLN